MMGLRWDTIILAGGRGSRLGGIDKASIELDRSRLVDRVITAARNAGTERVIVVGPPHTGETSDVVVREDPPFSGPAGAIDAGMASVNAPWVMVLACDLVHPRCVVETLMWGMRRLPDGDANAAGVILTDANGAPQWLASCVRTDRIRESIARARATTHGGVAGLSVRHLLGLLELREVNAPEGITLDIDTPEQLHHASTLFSEGSA